MPLFTTQIHYELFSNKHLLSEPKVISDHEITMKSRDAVFVVFVVFFCRTKPDCMFLEQFVVPLFY